MIPQFCPLSFDQWLSQALLILPSRALSFGNNTYTSFPPLSEMQRILLGFVPSMKFLGMTHPSLRSLLFKCMTHTSAPSHLLSLIKQNLLVIVPLMAFWGMIHPSIISSGIWRHDSSFCAVHCHLHAWLVLLPCVIQWMAYAAWLIPLYRPL